MVQTYSDNNAIYSVDMMFVYLKNNDHPIKEINVGEYKNVLEYSGWGDPSSFDYDNQDDPGKNIAYSAKDVIGNPKKYPDEYERILNANLSYPIIISANNDVIDGVHRLTKAFLEKKKKIKAYIFDEKLMKKFKIANKTKNIWEKIDKMQTYEFIDLYYKRFCNKMIGGKEYNNIHKYIKYKYKYFQLKTLLKYQFVCLS